MSEVVPLVPGIYGFEGNHRFLSNFWPAEVIFEGYAYPTVEHAYVAAKTLDQEQRNKVLAIPTEQAGKVKRLGRTFDLREDWEDVKVPIMEDLLRQKFMIQDLFNQLLMTQGFYIEETNTWGDTFWGVCNKEGRNILGLLIMKIRDEYSLLY
jgi:ribA/ribD-fused uncharacterized protein